MNEGATGRRNNIYKMTRLADFTQ